MMITADNKWIAPRFFFLNHGSPYPIFTSQATDMKKFTN